MPTPMEATSILSNIKQHVIQQASYSCFAEQHVRSPSLQPPSALHCGSRCHSGTECPCHCLADSRLWDQHAQRNSLAGRGNRSLEDHSRPEAGTQGLIGTSTRHSSVASVARRLHCTASIARKRHITTGQACNTLSCCTELQTFVTVPALPRCGLFYHCKRYCMSGMYPFQRCILHWS